MNLRLAIVAGLALIIGICCTVAVFELGLRRPLGVQDFWGVLFVICIVAISAPPGRVQKQGNPRRNRLVKIIFFMFYFTLFIFDLWISHGHHPIFFWFLFWFLTLVYLGLASVVFRNTRGWNREPKLQ
jgi:hypothetical protein